MKRGALARRVILAAADVLLAPAIVPAAFILKLVRRIGTARLPLARTILHAIGVFPIRRHYHEPQFDYRGAHSPLDQDRALPGIDWNIEEQLAILSRFHFTDELVRARPANDDSPSVSLANGMFDGADAVYYYNLIRLKKPSQIVEIGSGQSTLVALAAINRNKQEDATYHCDLRCIEPFEAPWLEARGVSVTRQRVESLDLAFFSGLGREDILFIDSSHVIRPQGDVVFEYLQLLPSLGEGVIVHIHDIFSPKNYPKAWVVDEVYLWNEQYMVEAFLTNNDEWKIIGSLNYLWHHHASALMATCPVGEGQQPRSFYIQKRTT